MLLLLAVAAVGETADHWQPLAGQWQVALDPEDRGMQDEWYRQRLNEGLQLPGSLQDQGFGDPVTVDTPWTGTIADRSFYTDARYAPYRQPGKVKVPFFLQPERHYVGPAWYQRDIEIPAGWQGQRILLNLERCHWETRAWLGDRSLGMANSLSTPHVYDLSGIPAGKHRLTIRVDNRIRIGVGVNAHSVTDHTQSNWNGLAGQLFLSCTDPVWLDDVQAYPDVAGRRFRLEIAPGNATGAPRTGRITVQARAVNADVNPELPPQTRDVRIEPHGGSPVSFVCDLGPEVQLWDEFHPVLYELEVELTSTDPGFEFRDTRRLRTGLRDFAADGTRFTINGRPTFLRGTLECAIFPLTGYPPTDPAAWKHVFHVCRSYGLNHMRFHSWCPPEAAFEAADEAGMYLQVECGAWANQGASIGDGKPVDAWLYAEAERILRAYGNHPSFVMMAYGNEPAGRRQRAWLGDWVKHWREHDPRRLYTSGAGWPAIPENDYHDVPQPRIQHWGAGLRSRINAKAPETMSDHRAFISQNSIPVVSHEIGQWCVFPDFDEIPKYTGVLKAHNFEIFRDFLAANHMGDQAREFLMSSGYLQVLCYKEEIEMALRTPGMGGFQLLDLHDFPGQGTALVGVVNALWEPKPYVTPAQYSRFCNSTVPLLRLPKRVWWDTETLAAEVEAAHFGPAPLEVTPHWALSDADGRTIRDGALQQQRLPVANGIRLGALEIPLAGLKTPGKYTVSIAFPGTPFRNAWDVWVYPRQLPEINAGEAGVTVSRHLDDGALAALRAGGKVLLLTPPADVKVQSVIGFSTIFWNTAWTRGQPPHTLGIVCDPHHPLFENFPTENHTDWQWWELIHGSAAMVLDDLPPGLRPLLQPIDTWFECRRLGLLFEAKVAGGSLLVCSMDLDSRPDERPVARQLRYSILRYMSGTAFAPREELSVSQVRSLFKEPPLLRQWGATVTADSEAPDYPAANVIDGDPKTIWHTVWEPIPTAPPHHLVIDLGAMRRLAGVVFLPRQDMANGRIAEYVVYAAAVPDQWGGPIAEGHWQDGKGRQTVRFPEAISARYLKLEARSEVNGNPFSALADVDVIEPK